MSQSMSLDSILSGRLDVAVEDGGDGTAIVRSMAAKSWARQRLHECARVLAEAGFVVELVGFGTMLPYSAAPQPDDGSVSVATRDPHLRVRTTR
jgi:hypothetical protein